MNKGVYQRGKALDGELMSLSTLLNVNREIHHSTRSLLNSVKLWQQLSALQSLPDNIAPKIKPEELPT